jgi:hypothetical protein
MMFGHLRSEDFVNLIEGAELSAKHRAHVESCDQCRSTWESMRSLHGEVSSMEADIPEPDWAHFRSSVRDELLSRSIQRQTAVRRWTGWTIRPAAVWALSVFMAVGITTLTVLWKVDRSPETPPIVNVHAPLSEPASDIFQDAGPERSLFADVMSLGEEQQEQLRQMLESAQKGPPLQ